MKPALSAARRKASTRRKTPSGAPTAGADGATGTDAPGPRTPTLEQAIGAQIRAQRRRHDLTGQDLARAAGISTGMLSKIENGQISPSLATLRALTEALSVPLTALFAPFEERRDCSFVAAGHGVAIERRGTKAGHKYQLLGHSLSGDVVVEPYLITLTREAAPYTAFQHAGVELIHMLSGRVSYRHADRSYTLRPGDTLFFDASAPHGPERLLQLPMTYLSIIVYPRS